MDDRETPETTCPFCRGTFRTVALHDALAEVDRLTAELEHAEKYRPDRDYHCDRAKSLAAEVDRIRSLPVIPTCGDCCNSGYDDRTEGEVCKHDDATADPDAYPAIATTAAPPSWCPLRGKAGGR